MINYKKNQYFKYSELSCIEKQIYYKSIYQFVMRLSLEYPNFSQWYRNLFSNNYELNSGREIILCENNYSIIGIAILKSNELEKKICTLQVDKNFQRQGIGAKLVEMSLEWLENDNPIITIHEAKQNEFSSLLNHYGFKLEQIQRNYYNFFSTELVYNGTLPENEIVVTKIELLDMQKLYHEFVKTGKNNFNVFMEESVYKRYMIEGSYCAYKKGFFL